MLITPMLAPLKMCHLFGWTLERYHLTDFAVFPPLFLPLVWAWSFFPAEYFRHLALLLVGCYGITIETFKALVATQLRHIVVRNTGIKKRFDASFSHRVVGEFPARRQCNGRFSWRLIGIGRFCFFPSVFLRTKSYLLVFVGDEQPGKKDFPVIWPLLVACKQTLYSKLLDIFGRLCRTL